METLAGKLSEKDIIQLKEKGINQATLQTQLENFKKGFPFVKLDRPATIGDGVKKLEDNEIQKFVQLFEEEGGNRSLLKFVPASGAASRMFKALFDFYHKKNADHDMVSMLKNIDKFAFLEDIKTLHKNNGVEMDTSSVEGLVRIADFILNETGLNYGHLPKGLIKFHHYEDGGRTAFEEHLVEGAVYSKDNDGKVKIHFTVSPEHYDIIDKHIEEVKRDYEKKFGVKYDISYSAQDPSTDTVAVEMDNELFREADGTILFRPGGHGALIRNLDKLDADMIFIKNIDNVVPDRLKKETYTYKKALGGYMMLIQDKLFAFQKQLDTGNENQELLDGINTFCNKYLGISISTIAEAKEQLFRPIRVCGMVKNDGDTGGGPFWIKGKDGVTLQIVETSQIDTDNPTEKAIVEKATHFNPVDLVCATKNYKGEKYNLMDFVNPEMGFITNKSKDGRELKAQELPGLWNGAMAWWTTVFVEVPLITFNPVKAVDDLLTENHQS